MESPIATAFTGRSASLKVQALRGWVAEAIWTARVQRKTKQHVILRACGKDTSIAIFWTMSAIILTESMAARVAIRYAFSFPTLRYVPPHPHVRSTIQLWGTTTQGRIPLACG